MHFFITILEYYLKIIMYLEMKISNQKTNYLIVSDEIISWTRVDMIFKFGHFLPSFLLTFILVIRILPEISIFYQSNLNNNTIEIPITMFVCFIPISLINGFIIEKILTKTNSDYFEYKESLKIVN